MKHQRFPLPKFSDHAIERKAERQVSDADIQAVLKYGHTFRTFSNRMLVRLPSSPFLAAARPDLICLQDLVVVLGHHGDVITVQFADHRFREEP